MLRRNLLRTTQSTTFLINSLQSNQMSNLRTYYRLGDKIRLPSNNNERAYQLHELKLTSHELIKKLPEIEKINSSSSISISSYQNILNKEFIQSIQDEQTFINELKNISNEETRFNVYKHYKWLPYYRAKDIFHYLNTAISFSYFTPTIIKNAQQFVRIFKQQIALFDQHLVEIFKLLLPVGSSLKTKRNIELLSSILTKEQNEVLVNYLRSCKAQEAIITQDPLHELELPSKKMGL